MQAIVDLVAGYWARTDEGLIVSSLKGMFAAASMAGNLLSIHSESIAGQSGTTRLNGRSSMPAPSWAMARILINALSRRQPSFMPKQSAGFILRPRYRVERASDVALGPGKVDLLEHIRDTGSIAEAAKRMEMSYMRAWTLVKTMEDCFKKPLVVVARGGAGHGGARLTETGDEAVALYRRIERESAAASTATWRDLRRLLRS